MSQSFYQMADSNIKGQGLYTQKDSSWKMTQPSPAPSQPATKKNEVYVALK